MSYLTDMQTFYPKSWRQRLAIQRYKTFCNWENKEPTTITIHELCRRYGGPEEGGWWYDEGYPHTTHCVFSKKQAIKTYLDYQEEYKIYEQSDLGLSTTESAWEISYDTGRAEHFPTKRPYYC
jgi:hypothetical protein